jgi:hypothetical protein
MGSRTTDFHRTARDEMIMQPTRESSRRTCPARLSSLAVATLTAATLFPRIIWRSLFRAKQRNRRSTFVDFHSSGSLCERVTGSADRYVCSAQGACPVTPCATPPPPRCIASCSAQCGEGPTHNGVAPSFLCRGPAPHGLL